MNCMSAIQREQQRKLSEGGRRQESSFFDSVVRGGEREKPSQVR